MKKKAIILLIIAGIFILALRARPDDSVAASVMENITMGTGTVSDQQKEWIAGKKTESKKEEVQSEQKVGQEPEKQEQIAVPEKVQLKEPVVKQNGKTGELEYDWNYKKVRVDADTLLFVSECYFHEEKLQQKLFFLAKAPDFIPREVFRQDYKSNDDPESLEQRMRRPHPVDGGYIYEMEGVLYFLDEDFWEASPICDLHQLMGDLYSFSPDTFRTCDVTADAARMLACTDEGLYEYDLKSGDRTLLEPAFFEHHEIILEEGDCACGAVDYTFFGPVKAEYGPDGQSYAFLTGTEEAVWGDIRGVVLRAGDGETLYQKEAETMYGCGSMYDMKWVESEDTVYLDAFYTEDDGKKIMDRVNLSTGEVKTFEAPDAIYVGAYPCCVVGYLDEDSLFYIHDGFEIYHPSSGERQKLEVVGEADWNLMVLDWDGRETCAVSYPERRNSRKNRETEQIGQ